MPVHENIAELASDTPKRGVTGAAGGSLEDDPPADDQPLGTSPGAAVTDVVATVGTNEVQTVTVDATGGAFKLTFDGQETADIDFDATPAEVVAALEALSNIGVGDVAVTGGPGDAGGTTPYEVTFQGALGSADQPEMTATDTLTGGAGTAVVATDTAGAGPKGGVDFTYTEPAGGASVEVVAINTATNLIEADVADAASPVSITGLTEGAEYDFHFKAIATDGSVRKFAAVSTQTVTA